MIWNEKSDWACTKISDPVDAGRPYAGESKSRSRLGQTTDLCQRDIYWVAITAICQATRLTRRIDCAHPLFSILGL